MLGREAASVCPFRGMAFAMRAVWPGPQGGKSCPMRKPFVQTNYRDGLQVSPVDAIPLQHGSRSGSRAARGCNPIGNGCGVG